jgi:hypothetical protein
MMVSAPNAGALFDLRCAVREGMVDWVQRTPHAVVPAHRIKPAPAEPDRPARRDTATETHRVASSLFSGSPEAERRGRAFDDTVDYEDEFATTNGRA